VIEGLDDAAKVEGVEIFHAGTKAKGGKILANGGRVLNVCAHGQDRREAQQRAYAPAVDRIRWPEGFCRRDIGPSRWAGIAGMSSSAAGTRLSTPRYGAPSSTC
jgi:phosphoribosylamine-glycine ligase